MLANIPEDTKIFLTCFYTWRQTLQIITKNFPRRSSRNRKSVEQD